CLQRGHGCHGRVAAVDHAVGGGYVDHVAACRVDGEVDVGEHASEGVCARHRDLAAAGVGQLAVVGRMRVARDDQVHGVVELAHDVGDVRPCEVAGAAVDVDGAGRRGLESA